MSQVSLASSLVSSANPVARAAGWVTRTRLAQLISRFALGVFGAVRNFPRNHPKILVGIVASFALGTIAAFVYNRFFKNEDEQGPTRLSNPKGDTRDAPAHTDAPTAGTTDAPAAGTTDAPAAAAELNDSNN